jgi:hypothetical protein
MRTDRTADQESRTTTHMPPEKNPLPRIQTPCPKRWDELIGDEKKRFCSECSLHVHNGAEMTRAEASALVLGATERVCMRLELDPAGAPVFRDSEPTTPRLQLRRRTFAARAAVWAMSTAAGVLAACARTTPPLPSENPALDPCTTNSTNIMGKVARPELLGDVAEPPRAPEPVRMGEATMAPAPTVPPEASQTQKTADPR